MKKIANYTIGIDEVGRGPLFGPVAVGVVLVPANFSWSLLEGVTDSKKLTAKKREVFYQKALILRHKGTIDFAVKMVKAGTIDKIGIVKAINLALQRGLSQIERRNNLVSSRDLVTVKLDGGLKAPTKYLNQQTIIKGDSKELVIGLASIVAKVERDNHLDKLALRPEYKEYGLLAHKGYGTSFHLKTIRKLGLTAEHRRSFCRRLGKAG